RREAGDHPAGRAVPAAGAPNSNETRHCTGDLLPLVRPVPPWRAGGVERSFAAAGSGVEPHPRTGTPADACIVQHASHSRGRHGPAVRAAVLIKPGDQVATAISAVTIPIFGHLSDRFGRKRITLIGAVAMAAWGFVYFAMMNTAIAGLRRLRCLVS